MRRHSRRRSSSRKAVSTLHELLECIDILTPNESEALNLLGRRDGAVSLDEASDVTRALRALGAGTAILKLGEHGAFLSSASSHEHFMAPKVGHYGIFSGRRWREVIYPRIREFIRKYD